MTDRQLRGREGHALGQLLCLGPIGAIAGGIFAPVFARIIGTWWDSLPILFTIPSWLRWDWPGTLWRLFPWPSVAVGGAVVGMLLPLVIFAWLARGIVLDNRASAASRLPVVDNFGAVVPRPSARASYARKAVSARRGR
ncbi:MAG: hypothetical protein FJ102_04890 [Deltaproteobacteria bacterium]|nr:hypothetical protein [Deltaproteobacteria bacterium]